MTSVARRSAQGIAWAATSGWTQFALGVVAFGIVTHRLTAGEIGSFGIVTLLVGLVEMTVCAPAGDALQQRRTVDPEQVHATFWLGMMLTLGAAILLASCAAPIARAFGAPSVALLLPWAVIALPLGPATSVATALLARAMRFNEISRIHMIASLVSASSLVMAIGAGAGVWGLLLSDICGRLVRLGLLWRASHYRPARPARLGAIASLMRFNLATIGTYVLGYGDRIAPNVLTGFLLGPAALGTLIVAQRVLDLLHQLVLGPMNSVTMAAIARLQDDHRGLRRLVLALYRAAALLGCPAFLGAIVLMPDLARLMGARWESAVLVTQVLLLVGLRTSTGMFNIPILRGLGHATWPLLLLGVGLALNLALVPLGSIYGPAGVAGAILVRTLATWPLGARLVRRATGIGLRDQIAAGSASAAAALGMAVATAGMLAMLPVASPLARLLCGAIFGGVSYLALVAIVLPGLGATLTAASRSMLRGERSIAFGQLRAGFGF